MQMTTLKDLEKYLDYEFSSGPYTRDDYKQFQNKYINYLRTLCKENGWELVNLGRNHYQFSAFIKRDDRYIYLSISDVRFFPNDWYNHILIRTAIDERDYHGGYNNYTSLPNLKSAAGNLFSRGY
jgi:hypothetical protein